MSHPLNITLIQTHLFWESASQNLLHLDEKINEVTKPTDVIVLPEMFTTGFTMNPEALAEEHGGQGLQWMIKKATEKQCVITGTISVKENNRYYNRLYWVEPNGKYQTYDKRHLFQMGKEDEHYTSGTKPLVVHYKGWNICLLICYDLRFPVWSRNRKQAPYDVLIYTANWPAVRSFPWKHLLIARAIENQCYVVGVNRVGPDGHGIYHSGDSCVLTPRGEYIIDMPDGVDRTETATVSYEDLQEFRRQFPVLSDADDFEIL